MSPHRGYPSGTKGDLDPPPSRSTDLVMVYRAKDGWRWRRVAVNGRIVAESGEAYERFDACKSMARAVNPGIRLDDLDD